MNSSTELEGGNEALIFEGNYLDECLFPCTRVQILPLSLRFYVVI